MGTIRDLFVQTETFVLFLACVTVKNRLPVPLPLERGYQLSKTASFTEVSSLFASIFSPSSNSPLIASVSEMGRPASSLKRSVNRRRRSRCTGARRKLRGRLAIFLGVISVGASAFPS